MNPPMININNKNIIQSGFGIIMIDFPLDGLKLKSHVTDSMFIPLLAKIVTLLVTNGIILGSRRAQDLFESFPKQNPVKSNPGFPFNV